MSDMAADMDANMTSDDAGREIRFGATMLILFFVVFLGWAAFTPLDAAVVAPGVVVVSGERQTVQHRDGGVISRIDVDDGQRVRQGQILIELSNPEVLARKEALLSQVLDLELQRAQLIAADHGTTHIDAPADWATLPAEDQATAQAALESHRREAESRRQALPTGAVDARIAGYQQEIVTINRQQQLLADELVGTQSLADRGLMPMTRVRSLQRDQAQLDGRRAELQASIAGALEDRAQQVRDIEAHLAQLQPQLAGARAELERTIMRAPTSGTVVGLHANTVGGVIRAGEGVMDIVPDGQNLIVEAQIRPDDADDLRQGLASQVRITAFRGRTVPVLHGQVQQVSADRFVNEHTGQPYFLLRVSVPQSELARLTAWSPDHGRMRPGLPAQVIVPTRQRTALQYLTEPLTQALTGSFREG